MRGELGDEEFAERGVSALAEELPHVGVAQGGKGGNFQFEKVVLSRAGGVMSASQIKNPSCRDSLEIDGVNTSRVLERVRQNIVAGTRNGQDDVVFLNFENACVGSRVLPGKGVDIFVVKLFVFLELVVIVDAPVVSLIPAGGEGQAGGKIDDGRFVGLGSDLHGARLLGCFNGLGLKIKRRQVRGFSGSSIELGKLQLRSTRVLGTAYPHVVWDPESYQMTTSIEAEDGAEAVFKVILT